MNRLVERGKSEADEVRGRLLAKIRIAREKPKVPRWIYKSLPLVYLVPILLYLHSSKTTTIIIIHSNHISLLLLERH